MNLFEMTIKHGKKYPNNSSILANLLNSCPQGSRTPLLNIHSPPLNYPKNITTHFTSICIFKWSVLDLTNVKKSELQWQKHLNSLLYGKCLANHNASMQKKIGNSLIKHSTLLESVYFIKWIFCAGVFIMVVTWDWKSNNKNSKSSS